MVVPIVGILVVSHDDLSSQTSKFDEALRGLGQAIAERRPDPDHAVPRQSGERSLPRKMPPGARQISQLCNYFKMTFHQKVEDKGQSN